jgi:hypothetical protein
MTNGSDTLQPIDHATLTPPVRQALGSETAEVLDWHTEQIHRSATAARIYRLSGNTLDRDETRPWSLILKVTTRQADRDDPGGALYWKREVEAYQSGLLEDLPGGLAAPRCFGTAEHPGGEYWIWLEDIKDDIGPEWPLERYGVVSRHLGHFNGAYLTGEAAIPTEPWLSSGWLRKYVARTAADVAQLRDYVAHPLMSRAYPEDVTEATLRLWAEHETLLETLDSLPQAFCHMDAFRRNLFTQQGAEGRDRTVAIDWAHAGTGAVGEEIVPLIGAGLGTSDVAMERAEELEATSLQGYLQGLREAGWTGDERSVHFAYAVASAMRYVFIGVKTWARIVLDDRSRARVERAMGMPLEQALDRWGALYRFELAKAGEARELMREL